MSTLMSADMNVTRPSTRVRAAPGGATTISFGDPSTTTVKSTPPAVVPVVAAPVAAVVEEAAVIVSKMANLTIPSSSKMVGIALATSVGAEEITEALGKSFASKNITNVVVSLVESPSILPYVAKQMSENCSVVLAVAVVKNDTTGLSQILTQALVETGLVQNCPIIPAIISPASLLELKASLSACTDAWSSSVVSLLALGVVEPTPLTVVEEIAEVVEAPVEVRPATAPLNSRRAPGGAATIVLG